MKKYILSCFLFSILLVTQSAYLIRNKENMSSSMTSTLKNEISMLYSDINKQKTDLLELKESLLTTNQLIITQFKLSNNNLTTLTKELSLIEKEILENNNNNQENITRNIKELELNLYQIQTLLILVGEVLTTNNKDLDINEIKDDYTIQKLLEDGQIYFNNGNYVSAHKIFTKLKEHNGTDVNILCYYLATLFYQNPGNTENYRDLKKQIETIITSSEISNKSKKIALTVLSDINKEEINN